MKEEALEDIKREAKRIFPDARLVVLEELPFYLKVRILLNDDVFIEIRINERNKRKSYALVKHEKRITGFDNLGGWHMHPCRNSSAHRKIAAPFLREVFNYFEQCKNCL